VLAADPVFASLPVVATHVIKTQNATKWEQGIDGGSWGPPLVMDTFDSSLPLSALGAAFDRPVESNGWKLDTKSARAPDTTRQWRKKLADGASAILYLDTNPTSQRGQYSLAGEVLLPC
jgi:hypothetical protein